MYYGTYIIIMYIISLLLYLYFWWSPFIPFRNLDEVFTNKHMALMSIIIRSRVNASMVLTIAYHLFIHNYIVHF